MKVGITGVTGRLGAALARHHRSLGHEVLGLDRHTLDLAKPAEAARRLDAIDFDLLVNPAAMTSLEACEDEPGLAQTVNGDAPGILALCCRKRSVPFIHVSTDYVFDGRGEEPLVETDPARPINHYGRTKLAGERAVLEAYPESWVARVSWVFGPDKPGFIETMLGREARGEPLGAIVDKVSCPTYVDDIARAFDALSSVRQAQGGLVHVCNPGAVSWYDYAREIFRLRPGGPVPEVTPLRLAEMKAFRAARPAHTAMSTERLEVLTGFRMRPWQGALAEYLSAGEIPRRVDPLDRPSR